MKKISKHHDNNLFFKIAVRLIYTTLVRKEKMRDKIPPMKIHKLSKFIPCMCVRSTIAHLNFRFVLCRKCISNFSRKHDKILSATM
jgi:hypothetical protein